jgi:hypothetical protein
LGKAHSAHANNVSRGFDRNRPGCLPTFVCGRANSHSAWNCRRSHVLAHQKHQGAFSTRNALQDRPLSVSKMLRCFWLQSACVSLPGPVLGWTELYAHLQCYFASCDWPRCADEATSTGISLTHALAFVSWAFLLQIQSVSVGRSYAKCRCYW